MISHNHSDKLSHHHHDYADLSGKKLLVTVVLNFAITLAELIGGLFSNSISLLSDAAHNLSDAVSVLISYIAFKISHKESTLKKTFGFKRIEILAALLNSGTLIAISIFIIIEAIKRLVKPEPVNTLIMGLVALIALLANLLSVLLLKKDSSNSINIKSAYLHMFGDLLTSLSVCAGSILIFIFKIYWIDAVLTIGITIYIVFETYKLLIMAVNILMQSVPDDIDILQIKTELEKNILIYNVHHIHLWSINDRQIHFDCHMDLSEDLKVSETDELISNIKSLLHDKFGIEHVTLQIEFNTNDNKSVLSCK